MDHFITETRWQLEDFEYRDSVYLVRRTCGICGMGLTTNIAGKNKCWHTESPTRRTCLGCGHHVRMR